jgi:Na+-transporting NADH:ubiquinone oxidoreductase subunit NqrE
MKAVVFENIDLSKFVGLCSTVAGTTVGDFVSMQLVTRTCV